MIDMGILLFRRATELRRKSRDAGGPDAGVIRGAVCRRGD